MRLKIVRAVFFTMPLALLAVGSERCSRDEYRFPVEMLLERWLIPAERLS